MPTIVAEALVDVADPLAAELGAGRRATIDEVVALLKGAVAPVEAPVAPPPWLRPDQVAPFRRVVASLRHHGAAMLADPVGSGKTYVALAVARELAGMRPVAVIVPAALTIQWKETAARLHVPIQTWTHESLSRGNTPGDARVVIVDESHRFRNPGTIRYVTLATWLRQRPLLLLTATPVVNRLEDLAYQLSLGLRSDALALEGVPDLLAQLRDHGSHPAYGRVVLCRPSPSDQPRAQHHVEAVDQPGELAQIVEGIDTLRLSTSSGIAALIRLTLLRALASSLPALDGALRRYRALLHHGSAASATGHQVTRAEIRRFSSATLDQMVMWELLTADGHSADLVLSDAPLLDRLLSTTARASDPRFDRLQRMLLDGEPTIVFTASRDTLTALRRLPWTRPCAWISGDGAGIGAARVDPATVLAMFRPAHRTAPGVPTVLLATDIAAEGLDLQRATRLVHFDLPWTPMRIEQREGRAVRLGHHSNVVSVVEWEPWESVEAHLRQVDRLVVKRQRIDTSGVSGASHWLYRWRSEFRSTDRESPAFAVGYGEVPGWLVGISSDHLADGVVSPAPADLIWIPDDGDIIEDPQVIVAHLRQAATCIELLHGEAELPRERVAEWIRIRLQAGNSSRWSSERAAGPARELIRRLQQVAQDGARRRDQSVIELAERTIDALRGGHRAGETLEIARLATLSLDDLRRRLPLLRLPTHPRVTGLPRLIGALRFILPP